MRRIPNFRKKGPGRSHTEGGGREDKFETIKQRGRTSIVIHLASRARCYLARYDSPAIMTSKFWRAVKHDDERERVERGIS